MSKPEIIENTDNFKRLINLVDKLRDIGLNDHISMPRIAVLGSQSSGKSSLLEAIVGLNFLPRGSGVVTRRPLELRLVRTKKESGEPYGLFKDDQKKYIDFNQIRGKIEALTDEICGKDKGIIDKPIILNVFSENCSDLTVIDLPGITRIPIGNQPKDIERITKEMVTRYCKDERTIILCVIPANADMSTSEALQLAQQLDPQGMRTIGVITKIDIMDKGTDARKMILNKEIPLKLGYIGVKGRSQEDINNQQNVKDALAKEQEFFSSHPAYRHLSKELLGTKSLVKKLSNVMYDHIKNVLPSILGEINHKIKNCESNVKKLGEPIPVDNKEKLDAIWRDISIFYEKFRSNVKGEFIDFYQINQQQEKMKILASAQIQILFNNLYKTYLYNYSASKMYRDNDISKIVRMYTANTLPGFVSVDCFVALMSPLLENMRKPALELLDKVYQILKSVGSLLINQIFLKMLVLRDTLIILFNELLTQSKEICEDYLNKLIDCETKVVYTKDPSYIISAHSWPDAQKNGDENSTQNQGTNQQNPSNNQQPQQQNQQGIQQNQQPNTNRTNVNQNPQQNPQQNSQQNPQHQNVQQNQNPQQNQQNQNPQQNQQNSQQEPDKANFNTKERVGMNKKERMHFLVVEMKKRIDKYFEINIRQLGDMIPKVISNFLINDILVNQKGQNLLFNVQKSFKLENFRSTQRTRSYCSTQKKFE